MKRMNEKQLTIVSENWRDIAMYDFLAAEVEKIDNFPQWYYQGFLDMWKERRERLEKVLETAKKVYPEHYEEYLKERSTFERQGIVKAVEWIADEGQRVRFGPMTIPSIG